MNIKFLLSFFVLLLFGNWSYADEIKLAIGGTPLENLFSHLKKPYEIATGDKLTYLGPAEGLSTEQLFKFVESGEAEGGCTATPWADVPEILKKNKVQLADFDAYKFRLVGMDLIQVLLDQTNTSKELTDAQIKGLFTGTITNWKEINGNDIPVKVIYSEKNMAMNFVFQKKLLDGNGFVKTAQAIYSIADARDLVHKTPGAIGITPVGTITDVHNVPKHTEVGRPLNFFTKGAPSERMKKFLTWISAEGPKYQVRRKTK